MKWVVALLAVALAFLAFVPALPVAVGVGEGWTAPLRIAQGGEGTYYPSNLAIGTGGQAFVTWSSRADFLAVTFISRYAPGDGWSAPIGLELVGSSQNPSVAVDARGHAHVVYEQSDPLGFTIGAARFVPGQGWVDSNVIGSYSEQARDPQIAVNDEGSGVAIWMQIPRLEFKFGSTIWANRYDVEQGWGNAVRMDTDNPRTEAHDPSVAIDSQGNAMVVWWQLGEVFARRYEPGAGWGQPVLVGSFETGVWSNTGVDMGLDSAGRAVVVWREEPGGFAPDYTPEPNAVRARHFNPDTGWGETMEIRSGISPRTCCASLAVSLTGQAWVSWGEGDEAWGSRFVPGAGWDEPVLIALGAVYVGAASISIAAGPDDTALAVWRLLSGEPNGDRQWNVMASRFEPGTAWEDPSAVTSWVGTFDTPTAPQVALNAEGGGIVTWAQVRGMDHGVWVAHLLRGGEGGGDGRTILLLVASAAGVGVIFAGVAYFYAKRRGRRAK